MTNRDHADETHESTGVDDSGEMEDPGWPWSFILLVVAGGIYLIFRFIQLGIELFN
ncbi:MAG: hypothetical protein M3132_12240 [Actinomycetia bacterium]|nr:hypothetical protein [Actinomycetes bacterium]